MRYTVIVAFVFSLGSCAHWQSADSREWCFNFDLRGRKQQPYCGYEKIDCKQTKDKFIGFPARYGVIVTSECYRKEQR